VLCASSEAKDRVVPVAPPEGATPGSRIFVAGFEQPPLEEVRPSNAQWLGLARAVFVMSFLVMSF